MTVSTKKASKKKAAANHPKPMDVWFDTVEKVYLHIDRMTEGAAVCGMRRATTGRWTVVKREVRVSELKAPRYTFDHYEGPTT